MSIDSLISQKHQNLVDRNDNLGWDQNHHKIDDLKLRPTELSFEKPSKDLITAIELTALENELNFNIIKDFSNIAEIFQNIESYDISDTQNNQQEPLLLKFQITDLLEPSLIDLRKLNKISQNKPAVIVIESAVDHKSVIYWKLPIIEDFFSLKSNEELSSVEVKKLNAFITNFLAESVQNNHLGLISKLSFQPGVKSISLDLLADRRDFNLLLLAAEHGNSEIVKILLQHGMNTNSLDNKVNAQTLAYQNQHFDVLYLLLKANLKFPASFDASLCTGKCKEFCDVTEEVHSLIKANDNRKLKEILNRHKNLKHFYNFANESALKVAILSGSYDTYKELTSRKFRYASHEDPAEYLTDLDVNEKRTIREIHNKFSEGIVEKHINVLIGNSFIYHDEVDGQDKQDIISRAYKSLDSIPLVRIILKIVAASKNFKIIFDFNRESVNVADPTVDSYTQGLFYVSGRIYVGAKQLLSSATEHEALANLAHELCHFTMNLVYDNEAKPFMEDDLMVEKEFQEISDICQKSDEREDIVDMVYEAYPVEVYHAELIVRPVHMLVYYKNSPEILARRKESYSRLFEFYEKKVVPELEKALPEIEHRDEIELKQKDQKISKLKKISLIGGLLAVLGVIAAIVIGFIFYTPTYSFEELKPEQQKIVSNSSIIYKNTQIQFNNLFPENSTAYQMLTSDHISQMLHGEILNFSDPHVHYLDELVTHSWTNLTVKLQQKFLTSNLTFQSESLKFKTLHESNPKVFDSLTSQQIIDVLDNKTMIISNMIKNDTKFIVERKFFDENLHELYYDFMHFINGNDDSCRCDCLNITGNTKTFESYYEEFRNQSLNTQIKKLDEIRRKETYTVCPIEGYKIKIYFYPYPVAETLLTHTSLQFDFEDVLKIANETKIFVLSAEAGTGKTVTFEQFTMRIKKKFPTRWVSYIDLKDHKELYMAVETLNDVKDMLEMIFGLSDDNKFEKETFEELFKSGNTIILWNGFDEISPEFSEAVLKILSIIKDNTENIQFICTRPLYTDKLRDKFSTKTYTLIPFTKDEQINFITQFLIANKVDVLKIPDYILKVQSIVNSTQSKEGFDTPLLLGMMAELVSSDVEIYETENLYELYRKFVEKKVQIWQENSAFAQQFLNTLVTSGFSIKNLHQRYAMRHELQSGDYSYKFAYFNALKLKVMRQKVPKGLTNDEVSRMGILFINGPKTFKFAHRTFAEFFVAQYFVENIYFAEDEPTDEEAERRIRLFFQTFNYPFYRIRIFIRSFQETQAANETQPFDAQISKVLRTKYQRLYFNSMKELNEIPLLDFWAKDNKVLTELLQVNSDETLYTATYNYVYYPGSKNQIMYHKGINDLGKKYLSDSQYQNFISDKNQKGIILWSSYCMSIKIIDLRYLGFGFHEKFTLDDELLKSSDPIHVFESIAMNLTKPELKVLLTSEIILNPVYLISGYVRYIFNETIWSMIEDNLTIEEQKHLLMKFFSTSSILYSIDNLNFGLNKLEKLYNSSEIYEFFFNTKLLTTIANFRSYTFQPLWNFFINHTTHDQQKSIMRQIVQNDCISRPFKAFEQIKYCYVFPPLNMLQTSLFSFESLDSFNDISKIYETYFNRTEMQEIIFSGTDFLPVLMVQGNHDLCVETAEYLKRIFSGNEDLLKSFLLHEIEPTNLNVFELFRDFNDPNNCIESFSKLLNPM
ncbi:uncharacterized protein [Chironomus tepperi]|uniref:uncharacterized protein n=1 Tax=Chironomus tepperi TaxID=113505 RepID=UPI00391FBB3C